MKFLVRRARLIRLLSIVTTESSVPKKKREGLVRLHAEGSLLSVMCNGEEVRCEATVHSCGVCFLRHGKLRALLQAYSQDKRHHEEIGQVASDPIGPSLRFQRARFAVRARLTTPCG